ncbi:MAG: hypothetical protein PVF74_12555 [Anaerolineales bacterium]|jgi:hypothetical protein
MMTTGQIQWLLQSDEPWTVYRTLVDLMELPESDSQVTAARKEMLNHAQVQSLVAEVANWPGYALKRHNDARHPIYKLSTLADFGVRADDLGMATGIEAVMEHQSPEGAFQILVNIPRAFGGSGGDDWSWMSCDTTTTLYALLALGVGKGAHIEKALDHLTGLVEENGYRCKADPELGKFRGPGRKADPCPIANVYALKALSQVSEYVINDATQVASEVLLSHWEHQGEYKMYLFGIGTDFRKIKYPYVWYDILHVVEVLSRFPALHDDPRFTSMVKELTSQADDDGRYTASSMYRAWKEWSFADKKRPSPWLTFLVMRMLKRIGH